MDHIRDLHEDWEVLATLGDTAQSLEFACILTGCQLRIFAPKHYYSWRGRGMRRRAVKAGDMVPGYLFAQGHVDLVLQTRLTRMRVIGTATGLEVAHLWEMQRQSYEQAVEEVRSSRRKGQPRTWRPGARVWATDGIFRGQSFTVVEQDGPEVRLRADEPLFMGQSDIVLDARNLTGSPPT